jgi:hypothetical protein
MKTNNLRRTLNIFTGTYLLVFALSMLILGWLNPYLRETGLILFASLYCCGLVPLSFFCATWLIWMYRSQLANSVVLILINLAFAISMALYSSPIVGLLFASLLFLLIPLLGLVDFLYVYQKSAHLRFIGWGSVGFMWSVLFAWRVKGDLFEEWIYSMTTNSNNLWWLYALMYGFALLVLAGIFGFMVDAFRVLRKELTG